MPDRDLFRGAYGLRCSGLPLGPSLQTGMPDDWPQVSLEQAPLDQPLPAEPSRTIDADRAELDLLDGTHRLVLTREPAAARYLGPPIPPDDLAHPYLGPVATVFARWLGREAFHGGAFVNADGDAIAVLGTKEAGKSTLMAALAASGTEIVADDMLVIASGDVFAGPRTIDLRAEPTEVLRGDLAVSRARDATRWRLALPPITPTRRMAGWVFLGVGPALALTPIGLSDRLTRLARWRAWQHLPSDPSALLSLAALPAWELTRPLTWETLPATMQVLRALPAPAVPI